MRKQILSLIAAALLLCSLSLTAFAHPVPDTTRTGSIHVTMQQDGAPVAGGSLTIYRVALLAEDDGNYSFALTDEFAPTGLGLEELQSATLAASFAQYAQDNAIPGRTQAIAADGTVTFETELGLYLVTQKEPAPGYNAVEPFLVAVPNLDGEDYVYDVDAGPKITLTTAPTPVPTATPQPTTPPGPTLPQTGQLNWPVPLLAMLGLCLFVIGWGLRYGSRKDGHEN